MAWNCLPCHGYNILIRQENMADLPSLHSLSMPCLRSDNNLKVQREHGADDGGAARHGEGQRNDVKSNLQRHANRNEPGKGPFALTRIILH